MNSLSVIIPLYNCEDYIVQAVDSVLAQKNVKIEVIVINDGSTDRSIDRLLKFGNRINIISIENSGASAARNVGLRVATGDYIMFLDADDFLCDDNVCSLAISKIEKTKSQMCMFLYTYYNNVKKTYTHIGKYPGDILSMNDCSAMIYKLIQKGIVPNSPCCKVIKREWLINNSLFFIEGTTAEDIEWFVRLIVNVDSSCVIDNDSYIYRKNLSTSVTGSFSLQKVMNHYQMIDVSSQMALECNDDIKKEALLSALSYQFCIWLSQSWKFMEKKEWEVRVLSLKWLLNYDLYPNVKKVRRVFNLFGLFTAKLLYLYYMYNARSRK